VVEEACFSSNSATSTSLCPNGSNFQVGPGAAAPTRCIGANGCEHGTHVAGIAAGSPGVAPDANIIAIQVFSRFSGIAECGFNGSCVKSFVSSQMSALIYAESFSSAYDIAAANLSLGGEFFSNHCDGYIPQYTNVI